MTNNHKVGLVFGSFLGVWHLAWSILVAVGLAQPLLDFIFGLHMLVNPLQVQEFSLARAVSLIVVTFVVGYIGGYVVSWLWNYFHK